MIAGGGTGGHVYPALALADELVRRGTRRRDPVRRGARARGRVVPEAGYAIDLLPGRGLQRVSRSANVDARSPRHGRGVRARPRHRARRRPAWSSGSGATRRFRPWRPRLAASPRSCTSRTPPRVSRTASPSARCPRRGIAARDRRCAARSSPATRPGRDRAPCGRRPTARGVSVFGGSLGAGRINDAALGLYDRWRDRADVADAPRDGPRNHEACAAPGAAPARRPLQYELVGYEDHMDGSSPRTRVCRAGAMTVAELAAAGLPAVLVPLPGAPGDHQTAQRRRLGRRRSGGRRPGRRVRRHRLDSSSRRCSPTRTARRDVGRRRARWAAPTPPPASPTSSRRSHVAECDVPTASSTSTSPRASTSSGSAERG